MTIYHWICLGGFCICSFACIYYFLRILLSGVDPDHAEPKGKIQPAIIYSFTKAMSPAKKETAFLHLPTYAAGLAYHLGTFLSLFMLILIFFDINFPDWVLYAVVTILFISGLSGLSIFIKRIIVLKVRHLSNIDDYISNLLVTLFHILIAFTLLMSNLEPVLFIYATILFLYIPIGKLRHTVYFFAARVHLAVFYGRRGVWPINRR